MAIYKYEVLNPTVDNKRPFFNNKKGLFIFNVSANYRYYIECAITDKDTGGREYYILLSEKKFDKNCRLTKVDSYGRCQIKVRGEVKDYIIRETTDRGNIEVEYHESTDNYDVYVIN